MLPINPAQIPQLYKKAVALQRKGQAQDALKIYATILNANAKLAEVHFQVARIHLSALDFQAATGAFARAAALKPVEGAIWQGYCEALIRLDDSKATSAALRLLEQSGLPAKTRQAVQARLSSPKTKTKVSTGSVRPEALQEIVTLLNAQQPAKAQSRIRALLKHNPKLPVLYNMLGTSLRALNQPAEAGAAFEKAVELDPGYAEALNNYGAFLIDEGDAPAAVTQLERARSQTPKSAPVLANLGLAYLEINRRDLALDLLNRALKIDPKLASAYQTRAQVHAKNSNHDLALEDLDRCLSLGLVTGRVHHARAHSLNARGDTELALDAVDEALALAPESSEILGTRATILQTQGNFEEADATFRAAFAANPENGRNYRVFSASHRFDKDDPLLAQMEHIFASEKLGAHDRMQLGFALSKAMEDTGQQDKVFGYLNTASLLMRQEQPYHIDQRRREIDQMKRAFAGFDPDDHAATGSSAYAPIFITGMPRSGTTLIEQILSSHSTVTGGGEVGRFAREGYKLILPQSGVRKINDVSQNEINALAQDYEQYMKALLPGSGRVTDKTIQTYFVMGLAWLALPLARIVVVRRDPRDNLLSVYKNVFPEGAHLYSYDQSDLAAYYLMFIEMIEFWREIAPDRFTEIWYEDLIANPEAETRALVAACGLDWEDACLNFHENKRKVDTLSVFQVRQPLYTSSLKAWQRYEKELQPLFEGLGSALPAETS